MRALGFDTSNYTTSAAWFDGTQGHNVGKLLEVKPGALWAFGRARPCFSM